MRLYEIISEKDLEETALVWAKKPKAGSRFTSTMVQKFVCSSGPRAGRKVASVQQCTAPIDLAKRARMKVTRAKTKVVQSRKTKKTKKTNPSSIMAKRMNKLKKRSFTKKKK